MVQNGKPLGQMVIKLGLDSSAFSDSLTGAQRATKTAVREMQAGFKVASGGQTTLNSLAAKQQGLTKVIQAQEKELGYLKTAYDNTLDAQGNATSKTAAAAQKYNDAQAKLSGYKQEMIATAGSMAEMEVKTQGLTGQINQASEKFASAGKTMQSIGSSMTKGVTIPIAAGAAAVTKAAVSWESDFAGVKKTNDEVVDSTGKVVYSYKDLENGLRDLATKLPASHREIANVAEAAGQLGIKTENIKSFTKTMIDLGESTNMSAETAATSLARFANITGMSQKDFDRLGSVIVDLGNNFATTESEITEMGLRLAGAGKQVGMSQGEILGLSTALSSVGIEAEAGGSAFSKVMIQMQLAVETGNSAFGELQSKASDAGISMDQLTNAVRNGGKEQKEVAEKMGLTSKELKKMYDTADKAETSLDSFARVAGLTSEEFAKLFKENPSKAIQEFIVGLKDSEKHGTSAIKVLDDMGITEVRLRDSLLRAANASGIFGDAIKMGNKAWKENTALTEEANKRYETTESKLKMLKNEAVNAAIDMGGPFVDALRSALEAGKPLIKTLGDLAKQFNEADPKTQQMIVRLLAFTAAAGPMLSITGKMTSGIGGLGKSFIDLSASMAKKKAITELTKELASGAVKVDTLSVALGGGASKMSVFGSAASTAAGTSGIGAMTAALGPLGPAILGIAGVGGALAIGYGAWKLFGEEAWNSSQRVKQWGSDVGAETDKTLDKVQTKTQAASGQFTLMTQGFSNDTGTMITNFEQIGNTLEESLIKKIEGLDKLIKELPASVDDATLQTLNNQKSTAEDALKTIQENTDRISEIKKNAAANDREVSVSEAKVIQDLSRNTTEAYVQTLDVSAKEKKKILAAMTGDVAKASEDEAQLWLESLGKQRRTAKDETEQRRKDLENQLKEMGYNLEGEIAQSYLKAWDKANDATIEGLDSQMATITNKYPDLLDVVNLANGELISSMGESGLEAMKYNDQIVESAISTANELSENAKKNADKLKWTANESSKAGKKAAQTWNDLVFDEKTGEVKSNVSEIVIEATKDITTWNNMRLVIHDANLDSNAKLIIGEAAIANGHWDGMAWEDKKAILKDEFSQNMYKALESSGDWNEMTFDEKKAILYSNTPETMAETMLSLGKWDEYQPEIKELKVDNYEFLQSISQSEEKIKSWSAIPVETKELYADNFDLLEKIYSSETSLNRWNSLPDDEKKILAENTDLLSKLTTSETTLNRWNQLPTDQKKMLADNTDLSNKIFASEQSYNAWVTLPDNLKKMMGDNTDIITKLNDGTIKLSEYDANNPSLKTLLGDSYNVQTAANQGENAINNYKNTNAPDKNLKGDSSNVQNASNQGGSSLRTYDGINPPPKNLNANDNASGPARNATNEVNEFSKQRDKEVTLTTRIKRVFESIGEAFGFKKGTNFHSGGDMIVNDQKGALYKELVEFPNGSRIIPEGRNVYIPNAPKGTKVYPAAETRRMVPHYADGVGVSNDSILMSNMSKLQNGNSLKNISFSNDNPQILAILKDIQKGLTKMNSGVNITIEHADLSNKDLMDSMSNYLATTVERQLRGRLQ
ncbi:phage tail tape measure protein [Enterococcus sp. AZ103]|uniref:phage tail tape measure protein n=1 Tax=Enterococcus sp. AZ103 TaxID=2774628 RepID=UPI003F27A83C